MEESLPQLSILLPRWSQYVLTFFQVVMVFIRVKNAMEKRFQLGGAKSLLPFTFLYR